MSADHSGQALLAAAARGSMDAQRRLFAAHFDQLYGFFRMLLPSSEDAPSAAVATLATAVERHSECPLPAAQTQAWLIELALELVPESRVVNGASPEPPRRPSRSVAAMDRLLRGVPDKTLAAVVRSLDLRTRQAVVLSVMAGLDDERVGRVVGVSVAEARDLREQGLAIVTQRLAAYQGETEMMGRVAREAAYHLRPQRGPLSDGIVAIRGTRAHVEPGPGNGFLYMALRALERLLHRLLGDQPGDELDEVGGPGKMPERPKATPGAQAFKRPKRTPSLREYQMPESTPGMSSYRTPKSTPSTSRLSNPRRPLGSASSTYGSRRYGR